jgi:flagellar hook-length control protein FliK
VAAGPAHVVDSAQLQVRGNNSELKISVQLPELGKVEVRAVTAHDVTTAHLTASHQDALQMLAADRTTLEQALKSRDVILGSLDSHARDSHGHAGGEQRQQSSQSSAQSSGGAPSTAATATTSGLAETGTAGLLPDYSSISVRA